MRKLFLAIVVSLVSLPCLAAEIGEPDMATYAISGKDGQPSRMQIRLSRKPDKWLMEGKEGDAPWKSISCDRACEYRTSTENETTSYLGAFPAEMQGQFDMACIQNVANAFCRVTRKDNPSIGGYAFVALVTGTPIPMTLIRVEP
ncbi:hypothetical protein [Polaromonas sp.]|uniref:hypothetical protein n=1 Tax=Polaromonas sp. TaxID=1869339 RepID=UPI003266FEB9